MDRRGGANIPEYVLALILGLVLLALLLPWAKGFFTKSSTAIELSISCGTQDQGFCRDKCPPGTVSLDILSTGCAGGMDCCVDADGRIEELDRRIALFSNLAIDIRQCFSFQATRQEGIFGIDRWGKRDDRQKCEHARKKVLELVDGNLFLSFTRQGDQLTYMDLKLIRGAENAADSGRRRSNAERVDRVSLDFLIYGGGTAVMFGNDEMLDIYHDGNQVKASKNNWGDKTFAGFSYKTNVDAITAGLNVEGN